MARVEGPSAAEETTARIQSGLGLLENQLERSVGFNCEAVDIPTFVADVEAGAELISSQVPSDDGLSAAEIESFLETGIVRVPSAIPAQVVNEWHARAFLRLRCDPADGATWCASRVHLPATWSIALAKLAPRLYRAACQLLGGTDRIDVPFIYDSFIINLSDGASEPWRPPQRAHGWHIDGNNYRHFLDSPETGLVCLIYWNTVGPRGGGTFFATDSLHPVTRYLYDRPDGLLPSEFNWPKLRAACSTFVEAECAAGDAILMHPFVLHAPSQNHSGVPRVLTNYGITLKQPMDFSDASAGQRSPVESAVLRALDVPSVAFAPARPRESFVAERTLIARHMLDEERRQQLRDATTKR